VGVVSLGVAVTFVTVLTRRVERAVDDARALDEERRLQSMEQTESRLEAEHRVSEIEAVLDLAKQFAHGRTMAEVALIALQALKLPEPPTTCSVAIVEHDSLRILAAQGAAPATIKALEHIDITASPWLGRVLAGHPTYIDDRAAFAAEHPRARVLSIYPSGSWAVVPFHVGEHTGLLSVHYWEAQPVSRHRSYLELVTEILAVALERAQGDEQRSENLHRLEQALAERDRIARTLSTTLLPPVLPDVDDFTLSAWLVPASDDEVAGDFYDLFASDGDWLAVLGDVCGKGAEAAAVTSLARYAVRVTALDDPDPTHIATVADTALGSDSSELFCTMALARYTAKNEMLEVVLAGHHYVRLVTGTTVTRLGTPKPPLGLNLGPYVSTRVHLPRSASVVLLSDGLVERSSTFNEDELDYLLGHCLSRNADDIAQAVKAAVLDLVPERADDLTLLVIRRNNE
jgi:sigma-B regulation protein RsbU (phosphoserine phosphatase)